MRMSFFIKKTKVDGRNNRHEGDKIPMIKGEIKENIDSIMEQMLCVIDEFYVKSNLYARTINSINNCTAHHDCLDLYISTSSKQFHQISGLRKVFVSGSLIKLEALSYENLCKLNNAIISLRNQVQRDIDTFRSDTIKEQNDLINGLLF